MYIFVAIQAMACQDQGLNIVKIKTNWNMFYIRVVTILQYHGTPTELLIATTNMYSRIDLTETLYTTSIKCLIHIFDWQAQS